MSNLDNLGFISVNKFVKLSKMPKKLIVKVLTDLGLLENSIPTKKALEEGLVHLVICGRTISFRWDRTKVLLPILELYRSPNGPDINPDQVDDNNSDSAKS